MAALIQAPYSYSSNEKESAPLKECFGFATWLSEQLFSRTRKHSLTRIPAQVPGRNGVMPTTFGEASKIESGDVGSGRERRCLGAKCACCTSKRHHHGSCILLGYV